jgi:tRNA pseudouridine32 synthase/23S rRNA pseudouridine746 synthase/23S rRNA pseudouridine1911/1915/1917 synthase
MTPTVLHHDDALLVLTKPAGMLAQADRTGDLDLLTWAKQRVATGAPGPVNPFVGLVHRLDRPTSGVMALARTPQAARALSRQFRERTVEKRYLALVEGTLTGIGTWTDTLAKVDGTPRRVAADHPDGKHAALTWQAVASEGDTTLLQIQLQTGRPHQIRLQGAARGHPVVGDTRYGAAPALQRSIALHHALLRLEHPATQRMQAFTTPVPDAWPNVLPESLRSALDGLALR